MNFNDRCHEEIGPSQASGAWSRGRKIGPEEVIVTDAIFDTAMEDSRKSKVLTPAMEAVLAEIGWGRNKKFALQMELAGTPCTVEPVMEATWAREFRTASEMHYGDQ